MNNGYYSEESKNKRVQEDELKELQKINEEETKKIDKIKMEYVIKKLLFKVSKKAYNNHIYRDWETIKAYQKAIMDELDVSAIS